MSDQPVEPAPGWSWDHPGPSAVAYASPPPTLLPGRSARTWFLAAFLLFGIPGLVGLGLMVGGLLWHVTWPFTLAAWLVGLGCLAAAWPYGMCVRRDIHEHRAGYTTLNEAQGNPQLWVLDARSGAVVSAPTVILVDDDDPRRVDGRLVQRRSAFRAARRRKALVMLLMALPLVLLNLTLRWQVEEHLRQIEAARQRVATFTPSVPQTHGSWVINAGVNAWLQVRNVEHNLPGLRDPDTLSSRAHHRLFAGFVNLRNTEFGQLPQWEPTLRHDLRLAAPAFPDLDEAGLAAFARARSGYRWLAALYGPGDPTNRWRSRDDVRRQLARAEAAILHELRAVCRGSSDLDESELLDCQYLDGMLTGPTT